MDKIKSIYTSETYHDRFIDFWCDEEQIFVQLNDITFCYQKCEFHDLACVFMAIAEIVSSDNKEDIESAKKFLKERHEEMMQEKEEYNKEEQKNNLKSNKIVGHC